MKQRAILLFGGFATKKSEKLGVKMKKYTAITGLIKKTVPDWKLYVCGAIIQVLIVSCGIIKIQNDTSEILVLKTLSRGLGYKICQNNPKIQHVIVTYCDEILSNGDPDRQTALIAYGISYITAQYADDPLMRETIKDLTGMIKIRGVDPGESSLYLQKALVAVEAFRDGAEMAAVSMAFAHEVNGDIAEDFEWNVSPLYMNTISSYDDQVTW